MSDSRSPSFFTIAATIAATGILAYAVYFDYKRRNDAGFRKQLKKEKKRIQKKASKDTITLSDEVLRQSLDDLKNEEVPESPEGKEQYFMQQVGLGEQLSIQGDEYILPASLAFFRALRVYPSPVELIVIYQKTVPEKIFNVVMRLTNLDVKARVEGYYEHFPPAQYNVKVDVRETPAGTTRKVLVAAKDFKAGDVIYKENPVVTALDEDLKAAGTHCFQCLQSIEGESVQLASDIYPSVFCSAECLRKSKAHSTSLLFTSDSPLPPDIPAEVPGDESGEKRKAAQTKFAEYLKSEGRAVPELAARFVARQVAIETQKLVQSVSKSAPAPLELDFAGADVKDYGLADHIERLRYLELVSKTEEASLLTDVLESALPGLKQFLPEDRYTVISGKMAYNSYGVCYNGGRDDKPESTTRPEVVERTRTPYGTKRQVGSAFYILSSYLQHSCTPTAQPSFGSGTAELTLLATKDIKEGDELTVAWVDVTQHPDESTAGCRRRRRYELARGWRFACPCERCTEEAKEMTEEEKTTAAQEEPKKDESVVEDVAKHEEIGENPTGVDVEDVDA